MQILPALYSAKLLLLSGYVENIELFAQFRLMHAGSAVFSLAVFVVFKLFIGKRFDGPPGS